MRSGASHLAHLTRSPRAQFWVSTLAELGDDYAASETDLIEVAALMCDLPEYEAEFARYVTDRIAF